MIVELALISDALKRMGVEQLTAVVPWLGYAKQDKVFQPGEPLSVKVVARLLQVAGMSRVVTLDLHNQSIVGFFEIPVLELSAKPLFVEYFRQTIEPENTLVVAPDAGAVKASTEFAGSLGVQVVYMDKKRDLMTGKVTVRGMSGEVKGKEIVIVDDNIVTGSTLISTAKELKDKGAIRVRIGVTHHTYVDGTQEKIEQAGEIDELVVTDTVAAPENRKNWRKLKILSVANMLSRAL
jgi:ribose-phosphate pyrophosphokinase